MNNNYYPGSSEVGLEWRVELKLRRMNHFVPTAITFGRKENNQQEENRHGLNGGGLFLK